MAGPIYHDFKYYRGDTYTLVLRVKDGDLNPLDLTGWTPVFTIASARGPNPDFSITATASISGSIITCTIPPAVGQQLINSLYVYDIQVSNGSTNVYTYVTGNITVELDVSEA